MPIPTKVSLGDTATFIQERTAILHSGDAICVGRMQRRSVAGD
jgi:hypothetical protein